MLNQTQIKHLSEMFLKGIVNRDFKNPITRPEVILGYKNRCNMKINTSDLKQVIEYLIDNGYPIGSTNNGYYWAKNKEELNHSINYLKSQVKALDNKIIKLQNIQFDGLFSKLNQGNKNEYAENRENSLQQYQ